MSQYFENKSENKTAGRVQVRIESKSNRIVKQISGLLLANKKVRNETGCFAVEGQRFTSGIPADWDLCYFACSENFAESAGWDKRLFGINPADSPVYILRDDIFKSVSDTVNPQGILAVCKKKNWTLENIYNSPSGEVKDSLFIIICENLQDPGNLGTLIRTADACGCDGIILSNGSADIYNPKVIRATAGSIFNIPIVFSENLANGILFLKSLGVVTYAAHLRAQNSLFETVFPRKFAILIGNEAHGLSETASGSADYLIKIPIIGKAESLNASVASGVIMYEALRQQKTQLLN